MYDNLAFIILNYKNYKLTQQAVDNVLSFGMDALIVIVDNDSPNASFPILGKIYEKQVNVKVIKNNRNLGYASGNNFGLKYIDSIRTERNISKVIIMNPDILIQDKEIINVLYHGIENTEYALLTVRTRLNGYIYSPNECAWHFLDGIQLVTDGNLIGKIFKTNISYEDDYYDERSITEVDVVQGCFFIADYESLKKVGFFDDRTFLYGEEAILAKKMERIGKKRGVIFSSIVDHNHQEKNRNLMDVRNKIFDSDCYHQSRICYIKNYSGLTGLFKTFSVLLVRTDMHLKRILFRVGLR